MAFSSAVHPSAQDVISSSRTAPDISGILVIAVAFLNVSTMLLTVSGMRHNVSRYSSFPVNQYLSRGGSFQIIS